MSDLPNTKQMWQPVKTGRQISSTTLAGVEQRGVNIWFHFFSLCAHFLTIPPASDWLSLQEKNLHHKHKHELRCVTPPHKLGPSYYGARVECGGRCGGMQTRCWADVDRGWKTHQLRLGTFSPQQNQMTEATLVPLFMLEAGTFSPRCGWANVDTNRDFRK